MERLFEYQKLPALRPPIKPQKHKGTSRTSHSTECCAQSKKNTYIQVQQVIGKGTCKTLVEFEVPFPRDFPAFELKENHSNIKGLILTPCKDKVILSGILDKTYTYQYPEESNAAYFKGIPLATNFGVLRYLSVDVPFQCFVEIAGTQPGDDVHIDSAGVHPQDTRVILTHPFYVSKDKFKVYGTLKETAIVEIQASVLRSVEMMLRSR